MRLWDKGDFPVDRIRQFLEPGPVVLVSSAHSSERNIMTMGWYTVLEFTPSLVGCMIWDQNHSYDLIRKSGECVINVPCADMIDIVARVGNTDGEALDKFAHFALTAQPASHVGAPLIGECFVSLECRLHDDTLARRLNFLIFEVIKAHAAIEASPQTLHYKGEGKFMVSGSTIDRRELFTKVI